MVTKSTYDNSKDLATAVMEANTPLEIQQEIIQRLSRHNKNRGSSSLKKKALFLKHLSIIARDDKNILYEEIRITMNEAGLSLSEIQRYIHQAENDGILCRAGKDKWIFLEP